MGIYKVSVQSISFGSVRFEVSRHSLPRTVPEEPWLRSSEGADVRNGIPSSTSDGFSGATFLPYDVAASLWQRLAPPFATSFSWHCTAPDQIRWSNWPLGGFRDQPTVANRYGTSKALGYETWGPSRSGRAGPNLHAQAQ